MRPAAAANVHDALKSFAEPDLWGPLGARFRLQLNYESFAFVI
ncbi:MAG: hypothetical protein KatS3mg122_2741 [Caldimonas sp.]|nr:MAG: hypothetical protein KatS3mg122_2741 [Caldimonas sp.]